MKSRLIDRIRQKVRDGSYLEAIDDNEIKIAGEELDQRTEYDGILGMHSDEPSHMVSSNIEASILELQEVLKYTPFKENPEKNPKFLLEPIVEAEVRMQKSTVMNVEWKPYYMSVVDSVLYLKHEKDKHNSFAARICFSCVDAITTEGMDDIKIGDLYFAYLEKQNVRFCFKIYTPRKALLFLVESVEKRDYIVEAITDHLKTVFNEELWNEKVNAAKQLEPLMREQFVVDLEKQEMVLQALTKSGIVSDVSILQSQDKEQSGVLKMYQHNELLDKDEEQGQEHWVEYYFVLYGDVLYFFKHSKANLPTGFVSLRYASIDIDRGSLLRDEYIFTVTTPLRTMTLMTKHAVSLSTWISALERSVIRTAQRRASALGELQKVLHRRDSDMILKEIERFQSPIFSLTTLLKSRKGVEAFREYLKEQSADNELECLKEIKSMASIDSESKMIRSERAKKIVGKFVDQNSPEKIQNLDKLIIQNLVSADLEAPNLDTFKDLWQFVIDMLRVKFENFKDSEQCKKFISDLKGHLHPDERKFEQFDVGEKVLGFVIDLKAKGKMKPVRFDMSKSSLTIGRDISNDIVIEDERISRAHARIEYSRTHCKYLDLGSSHGSKLNGESFTTSNLQINDTIKIGSTTLALVVLDPPTIKKIFGDIGSLFRSNKAFV